MKRFLLISIILFLVSCAPEYYPGAIKMPMMKEKGEIQAAAGYAFGGFYPQFAFSASEHFGIMFNAGLMNQNHFQDNDELYRHHIYLESGIGYFTKLSSTKHIDIWFGAGTGGVESLANGISEDIYIKSKYNKYFIQPGIYKLDKFIDYGFAARFSLIEMNYYDKIIEDFKKNNTALFVEPVFTARIGLEPVSVFVQTGISIPILKLAKNEDLGFQYQPLIFGVGVQVNIEKAIKHLSKHRK